MVLHRLDVTAEEFERATGWKLEPEGACQDDVCVRVDDQRHGQVLFGLSASEIVDIECAFTLP